MNVELVFTCTVKLNFIYISLLDTVSPTRLQDPPSDVPSVMSADLRSELSL